jgi:hypothetical protein
LRLVLWGPIVLEVVSAAEGLVLAVCHLVPVVLDGLLLEQNARRRGDHGMFYGASVCRDSSPEMGVKMYPEVLKMPETWLQRQIPT